MRDDGRELRLRATLSPETQWLFDSGKAEVLFDDRGAATLRVSKEIDPFAFGKIESELFSFLYSFGETSYLLEKI